MKSSMGEDFCECPALEFGERTGFNDADAVADLGLAGFVVDVVFFRPFDDLVEFGVGNSGDMLDDEGLVHFIGHDDADAGLAVGGGGFRCGLAHGRDGWALGLLTSGAVFLFEDGVDARDFAADDADAVGVFELAGGLLEAEVECLLLEVAKAAEQLVLGGFADDGDFGKCHGGGWSG